jgi:hypothetical protein
MNKPSIGRFVPTSGGKKLSESCKCVEEMKVGRGLEWKGEKVLHVHDQGVLGKCRVGASHSHKGLEASKGNQ